MIELGIKIPNRLQKQYKEGQEVLNKNDDFRRLCLF